MLIEVRILDAFEPKYVSYASEEFAIALKIETIFD